MREDSAYIHRKKRRDGERGETLGEESRFVEQMELKK